MHMYIYTTYAFSHTPAGTNVNMHMHTCTHAHALAHAHMHTCTCTCTCTHAHMHTCIHAHAHAHAHMHTCIHAYMHMHIYTPRFRISISFNIERPSALEASSGTLQRKQYNDQTHNATHTVYYVVRWCSTILQLLVVLFSLRFGPFCWQGGREENPKILATNWNRARGQSLGMALIQHTSQQHLTHL